MATKAEESLTDKAASAAHEAINQVAATAAEAEERIRKAVAEAEQRVRASTRDARDQSEELAETIGQYAQQHPLATVGIAFAAGFLLASLFKR